MKRPSFKATALLIGSIFFLDVASKFWVTAHLKLYEVRPVTRFFDLVLTINRGVSFSMFQAHQEWGVWALIILTGALSAGIFFFMLKSQTAHERIGFACVFAGAIGNLFDRIRIKGVIDFLSFHWHDFYWPAFNVADISVCFGAALLLWHYIIQDRPSTSTL